MTTNFIEKYFEAPEWGFSYFLRSKIDNDMAILDMDTNKNNDMEISFFLSAQIGRSGQPDKNGEIPHFTANRKFTGMIVCSGMKEVLHQSEPKGKGARIHVSKWRLSKNKKIAIIDSESKQPITTLICKKLSLKGNMIEEYKK